jgi:hypothetical protein
MVEKRFGMHSADPKTSRRTRLVLELLTARGDRGATQWEIQEYAKTTAPSTAISELRKEGYRIPMAVYEGQSAMGRKIYRYFILADPPPVDPPAACTGEQKA